MMMRFFASNIGKCVRPSITAVDQLPLLMPTLAPASLSPYRQDYLAHTDRNIVLKKRGGKERKKELCNSCIVPNTHAYMLPI